MRYGITLLLWGISLTAWAQRPIIAYMDKTHGSVNEVVTLSGAGFADDPTNLNVTFGAASAEIVYASEFLLEVKIPSGASYGPVRVTNLTSGLSGDYTEPFTLSFGGGEFDPAQLKAPQNFTGLAGMYDLCACDFNLDGKVDVATTAQFANLIDIFVNNSVLDTIRFSKQPLASGVTTINIQCGDLDNDGLPDLIASRNQESEIIIFRNTTTPGSSTLSWSIKTTISVTGKSPRRLEIVDLNLDGKPEIILTNDSNNLVAVFRNNSTPGNLNISTSPLILNTPTNPKAGLSIADFNDDGYPEIVVAGFVAQDLFIFRNQSDPENIGFDPVQVINLPGFFANVQAIDLDQDGMIDLATTDVNSSRLKVLRNTSSDPEEPPTFAPPIELPTSQTPWGITPGDINGDGITDLIVPNLDGNGRLSIYVNYSSPGNIVFQSFTKPTSGLSRNAEVVDVNGDGKPDVLLNNLSFSSLSILRNENCLIPQVSPSETVTICEGLEFELSATESPGTTYRWSLNGAVVQETEDNTILVDQEGEYLVTAISDEAQCLNSSPGVVQLVTTGTIPAPPAITEPGAVCIGEDVELVATNIANATYVWSGPQGFHDTVNSNTITVPNLQPQSAGRYFVEVLIDGCQSGKVSAVAQVVNLPFIEVFNRNESPNLCLGDSVELEVVDYFGYTYQWSKDDVILASETATSLFVSTEGSYQAEIIDPQGCTFTSDDESIIIFDPPSASFSIPDATCAGEEITFNSTSTVDLNATVEYQWNFGNTQGEAGDSLVYQYPGSGDFIVSLFVNYPDVPNCEATRTRPLRVISKPVIQYSNSADTLGICPTDSLMLTVTNPFDTYEWSTGANTPAITVIQPGKYTIITTNNLGCKDTLDIQVDSLPLPNLLVRATPDIGIVRGDTAVLTVSGAQVYLWEPETGLSANQGDSLLAFPSRSTEYKIIGMNRYSCIDSTSYFLEVFPTKEDPLPQAFSPNGDGIDDQWILVNDFAFSDCQLKILNRNGVVVYQPSGAYDNTWDGTYRGRPLPEGVYYYIFECPEGDPKTGSILLVR